MLLSKLKIIEDNYNVKIYEGENFKQAYYNGRVTDSIDYIIDKIKLTIKHYPNKDITLGTNESDETSPYIFCFVTVNPVLIDKN